MTIESFCDQLSLIIYYLNFAKSFPVNTLTSPFCRHIFHHRILKIWHRGNLPNNQHSLLIKVIFSPLCIQVFLIV
jgi:hypothetical protein